MEGKKTFGLIIPKKSQPLRPKSGGIFGSDSDDDLSTSKKKSSKIPQSKPISSKKITSKETIDPSIYEYDNIYDDMKAEKAAEIAPKVQKSSRYIDHLLKAADKRKKEYERRVEKKVQVEREKEGDKFKDKEMFVTAAYKKKVQEREEEEERERRENMLNDMMDVTKQKDLSGFYRHFLKQTVGEEKVPVFGERTAIKEEVVSDPEGELLQVESSSKDNVALKSEENYDDKDLSDDDSSSSENSGQEGGNTYEKSMRKYRKKSTKAQSSKNKKSSRVESSKDSSGSESEQEENTISKKDHRNVKDKQKHRSSSKSGDDVSNDSSKESKVQKKSINVTSKRNVTEDQETEHKQKRVRLDSDSSEVSDSLDSELINDKPKASSVSTNGLEKDHDDKETKVCKKSRNIFEKRTVGDVFADAQARYFQRLAARSS